MEASSPWCSEAERPRVLGILGMHVRNGKKLKNHNIDLKFYPSMPPDTLGSVRSELKAHAKKNTILQVSIYEMGIENFSVVTHSFERNIDIKRTRPACSNLGAWSSKVTLHSRRNPIGVSCNRQ